MVKESQRAYCRVMARHWKKRIKSGIGTRDSLIKIIVHCGSITGAGALIGVSRVTVSGWINNGATISRMSSIRINEEAKKIVDN